MHGIVADTPHGASWGMQVKQARGAIVRHMCLCEAVHPAELKSFTGEHESIEEKNE